MAAAAALLLTIPGQAHANTLYNWKAINMTDRTVTMHVTGYLNGTALDSGSDIRIEAGKAHYWYEWDNSVDEYRFVFRMNGYNDSPEFIEKNTRNTCLRVEAAADRPEPFAMNYDDCPNP